MINRFMKSKLGRKPPQNRDKLINQSAKIRHARQDKARQGKIRHAKQGMAR